MLDSIDISPAITGALIGLAIVFVLGLGVFAFAMWWDMSDRERRTRRSDVAFWLHLAAAPLIAHPIFHMLGVLDNNVDAARALLVIATAWAAHMIGRRKPAI